MFDHVGVVFRDLNVAGGFYRALMPTIGVRLMEDHTQPDGTGWLVFSSGAPESPFFVVAAGRPTFWRDGDAAGAAPAHLAFSAPSRAAVDAFHAEGLRLGARDNGGPGVRRGRYYCAFLIDPDGNNIEAGVYADA
ncbi:MAG TPA: VOC family protein [Caulobacteraceae bacterium]|jgi:catechol 2,3-dioxygenase-like lactoylglutathione lyase family enzyme